MTISDQLQLALQAYAELQPEISAVECNRAIQPGAMTGDRSNIDHDLLPDASLLLGIADDGLPVLLNLKNPVPGPILVIGGKASGKTDFLQFLANGSELLSEPGDTQFGVITQFPEEWEGMDALSNSLGVWSAFHPSCDGFLSQLISWADVLPRSQQFVLLLIDDLDMFGSIDLKIRHKLQWLLKYGPEKHIWPVATVEPLRCDQLAFWTGYFHTQVFGQVDKVDRIEDFFHVGVFDVDKLVPGKEFAVRLLDDWLKFSLPSEE